MSSATSLRLGFIVATSLGEDMGTGATKSPVLSENGYGDDDDDGDDDDGDGDDDYCGDAKAWEAFLAD